jgi:DNA-binding LytR/AlgR family response regulator
LPQKMFMKIHRSFIVNTSQIEYLEDNHVKVGDKLIPISRHYIDNVTVVIGERLLKR